MQRTLSVLVVVLISLVAVSTVLVSAHKPNKSIRNGSRSPQVKENPRKGSNHAATQFDDSGAIIVFPHTTVGPIYDKAPTMTVEQLNETKEKLDDVDLHPLPPGQPWSQIPAPTSPPTTPITSTPAAMDRSQKLFAEPEASGPTDFRYQAVHDLSLSETSNTAVVDEPSIGSMGNTILITGNWYASLSTDAGKSFKFINPSNTFPSANRGFCCDQIVNYAPVQDMMIWALQYIKDDTTNTLRIARAVGSNQVGQNSWTYYDFKPQDFGWSSGNWFDFPTLTVSATYLYVTSNVFSVAGNGAGAAVWRIKLSDLAAGVALHADFYPQTRSSSDPSSFRCTEGAGFTMYCGALSNDYKSVRIVHWDDSGTPEFEDKSLDPYTPISCDPATRVCDGLATSPDGSNWAARADTRMLAAWDSKGVLGFMWSARQDASFPYPYTIVAQFDESTRNKVSQTPIWSAETAFLYPSVAVNSARNLAGLISYGGGLYTPGSNIWISDDVESGFAPLAVYGAAPGSTNGPNSNEWGDYQTVRRHKDSTNTWVAATFRLQGGSGGSSVVPRYLWFGRIRDLPAASPGNANLTPYLPFGWSDKIVVSRFPNTSSDNSLLSSSDTLYVDWAVINNGNQWTEAKFFLTFYVDGVSRGSWYSAPVLPNDYVYLQDVKIAPLTAGNHTLRIVADSTSTIGESNETDNEYTKTITVSDVKPNLTPFRPSGWSDKIVVSNRAATNTDDTPLNSNDSLFVDWAAINSGGISTQSKFYTRLFVDNGERASWYTDPPLNTNFYVFVEDVAIGKLTPGPHTIKIVTDSDGNVGELNESDNEYSRQINITAPVSNVQLSSASYAASEGAGIVNINVIRSGDNSSQAAVAYATSNGTAKEGKNYVAAQGVLTFAAGETSKSFPVLVIDNAFVEGARTVNLTLSNPTGGTLGTQSTAVLTINDNDTSTGANPIDQPHSFVEYHYFDFLGRYPDQGGWDFWTNNIAGCTPQPSCLEVQRINTSAAYFLSIEFQQTGYLVYKIYKASFGNLTDIPNAPVPIKRQEFLPDTHEIGNGVIVNQGNWQQQLEANKQAFTLEFVQRARFTAAFPTTMTPAQFVDKLFSNAGVTPTATDRNAAIAEFGSAGTSGDVNARSRALRDVAENGTLNVQEFNKAFVLMQYFGYLRRNPYDSPEPTLDYAGFNFWLGKLNSFGGNYISAEMVKAFISSSEYRQRFGP
jgi:hypothetical protein